MPIYDYIALDSKGKEKKKVIYFKNDTIESTYPKQLYSFFNSIIKDKSPLYDLDEGIKTLKLIMELYDNQ